MEQIIKIFENEEFGKVRTVIKDGEQRNGLDRVMVRRAKIFCGQFIGGA